LNNKNTLVGFNTLVKEYSRHDKTLIHGYLPRLHQGSPTMDKQVDVCSMKLEESSQPHMEEIYTFMHL